MSRASYFSWCNLYLLSVAGDLGTHSIPQVGEWSWVQWVPLAKIQINCSLWPTDGNYCCCWSQRNSKDLFTSVARVIKKINMSCTTIFYNGRKELRSYFRLGNVTEILIFKCRQKTRLSQRVMHGIHFISVTKALIFP